MILNKPQLLSFLRLLKDEDMLVGYYAGRLVALRNQSAGWYAIADMHNIGEPFRPSDIAKYRRVV